MPVCTFFGHRICPDEIKPRLRAAVESLITEHGVDTFYIGSEGGFDSMARSVIKELSELYPHIRYFIALAYPPVDRKRIDPDEDMHTILPEGIENVPKRFAISYRNDWLLKKSEFVIAYIEHDFGGAAKFCQKAVKAKKAVINLIEK